MYFQISEMEELHDIFMKKLKKILLYSRVFPKASEILDHLYLGNEVDAKYGKVLKEHGITHVVNCAQGYIRTGTDFYKLHDKQKYIGFNAEDHPSYDMMQHFDEAFKFIEEAREFGGKVLVHCVMGINRSGLLVIAYVMVHKNMGPLSAAKFVKQKRDGALVINDGFKKQLIQFAEKRGLLEKDLELINME